MCAEERRSASVRSSRALACVADRRVSVSVASQDKWQRQFMRFGAVVDRLSRPFMTIELDHRGSLPNEPLLMAANHRSLADVFVAWICCYRLGRPTRFIVARVFFKRPVFGTVLRAIGCIEGGRKSGAGAVAIAAIGDGYTCAIMPEGAITEMQPGHILGPLLPGVAEIWEQSQCPFVAVGITGAGNVWKKDGWFPRIAIRRGKRALVHVRVADPAFPDGQPCTLDRVEKIMESNCVQSALDHGHRAAELRAGR